MLLADYRFQSFMNKTIALHLEVLNAFLNINQSSQLPCEAGVIDVLH